MWNEQSSQTALTAAAARAAHLIVDGEPRIFADTLAARLLGDNAEELIGYHRLHGEHPVLAGARTQVTCRGRYTENVLSARAGDGEGLQYVILGAGLDSFGYRNPYPEKVRVFEVDHPATQDAKRAALANAGIGVPAGVTHVPADLADADAGDLAGHLEEAGFDRGAAAVVSWLGVTMYLTPEAVGRTLAALSRLAPGTEIIADYMLPEHLRDPEGTMYGRLVAQAATEGGEPWLSAFSPAELSGLAEDSGISTRRHVAQRDTIPARLWERPDSLRPAALAMLFHGTVPAENGAGEDIRSS